jgi:hypothetical protein
MRGRRRNEENTDKRGTKLHYLHHRTRVHPNRESKLDRLEMSAKRQENGCVELEVFLY